MMSKIPCLVVAYYDVESVKATIGCLLERADDLDLMVIENPSEFTQSSIKPYVLDLVDSGAVSQYFLFDENISNNAVETILTSGHVELDRHQSILLTDGDLQIDDQDWLGEQIRILGEHQDVFACAVRLSLINLPVETCPDACTWLPPARSETDLYTEVATGMHMLLVRTAGLRAFLSHMRKRNLKFRDSVLCDYCYQVLGQKWVSTKRSTARHLAWDRYGDRDHPYTKLKVARSFAEIWDHDSYCGFERYTRTGSQRCSSNRSKGKSVLREFRELWRRAARRDQDPGSAACGSSHEAAQS